MHTELSVKIKNSSQNYTQKFLLYDDIIFGKEDKKIEEIVQEAKNNLIICDECLDEDLKIDVKIKKVIQ